jgi:ApeA-like protein/HEPN superfamily Apea-like protein
MPTNHKQRKESGRFLISGARSVFGELKLAGRKSSLHLYDEEQFDIRSIGRCLKGTLLNLTKISLIDCVTSPPSGSYGGTSGKYYFADVFPHFVVEGDHHLDPDDHTITKVRFLVDDASTLLYDFDAFSFVRDPHRLIDQVIQANSPNREMTVGANPQILYFTGKWEIFAADTVFGTISATHNTEQSLGGPDGVYLKNRIFVSIDFRESVVFDEAVFRMSRLVEFLGLLAGRPQNLNELYIELSPKIGALQPLKVHWSFVPKRNSSHEAIKPQPSDVLLDAVNDPEEFSRVLSNWLSRQEEWHNARLRFFNSFKKQLHYDIDRLISSANMFDVLPHSAVPSRVELTTGLQNAKTEAQQIFARLPRSPERDSVLNILGRVGRSNLKQKIRYRAKPVIEAASAYFDELPTVIDEAVNCRNYYIHGSEASFDYNQNFGAVVFLIETLEFVFATSDLIQAGWNINAWTKTGKSLSHPLGRYVATYTERLETLKTLLG